jgi:hypothetical protein
MKIGSLIEVLSAIHLSSFINSPFPDRGGIMLVGPPGSLKTAISEVLDNYPSAIILSDLTVKQGARLREDISSEKTTTLAFSDFAKLYQRAAAGAANIEGFLRALTGEGFRRANWEDSRMTVIPARACVVACMTERLYTQKYGDWLDDGFARRFLWSHFKLADPWAITNAIIKGVRLEFGSENGFNPKIPTSKKTISAAIPEAESKKLLTMLRHQPGREIGLIVMQKMLCALRWKFPKEPERGMAILEDFSESLTRTGTSLTI